MKKVISLLLVMCCFVSAFSFGAYAKYDKEILFRDIPWGCKANEVMDYLSDIDAEWEGFYNIYYVDNTSLISHDYSNKEDFSTICRNRTTKINEKVAGYDLKSISLYFALTDNNKQYLDYTSLYMVVYEFDYQTMTETQIEKLKESLSSVYGKYDEYKQYRTFSGLYWDYYDNIINGSDNTAVHFVREYSHSVSLGVEIIYTGGDGAEIAKKNMELMKKNIPISSDGL